MGLDIDELLKDMVNAMKNSIQDDIPEISDYAKEILERRRDRLEMLIDLMEDQLNQQKKVLETELLNLKIMSKVSTERAANAALDVLMGAVRKAISL